MESLLEQTGVVLGLGLIFGYLIGIFQGKKSSALKEEPTDWWGIRKTLTGTQLQILQHLEAKKNASIRALQDKFSFIPDRELYYRLEQIYLMGFLLRDRKDGEVVYALNPEYAATVEDDKTVMLSRDEN